MTPPPFADAPLLRVPMLLCRRDLVPMPLSLHARAQKLPLYVFTFQARLLRNLTLHGFKLHNFLYPLIDRPHLGLRLRLALQRLLVLDLEVVQLARLAFHRLLHLLTARQQHADNRRDKRGALGRYLIRAALAQLVRAHAGLAWPM